MSRKNDVEFALLHAAMRFITDKGLMPEFDSRPLAGWCSEACSHDEAVSEP